MYPVEEAEYNKLKSMLLERILCLLDGASL